MEDIASGRGTEVLHRNLPLALRPGDSRRRPVGDEHRSTVGGGAGVAEIAAERGPPLDRDAADDRGRIHQSGIVLLNDGVFIDTIAGYGGPYGEAALRIEAEVHQFWDLFAVYHHGHIPNRVADLGEQVGPARQDAGMRPTLLKQRDGLLQ